MKILLALFVFLAGCASFVSSVSHGHPNRKELAVAPGGSAIMKTGTYVDRDYDGYVMVPRGNGAFRGNSGWIIEGGYRTANVEPWVNPWILGNFIPYNGLIVGMGVDFIGGGAYNPHVAYLAQPLAAK